jgi:hypothetical protein
MFDLSNEEKSSLFRYLDDDLFSLEETLTEDGDIKSPPKHKLLRYRTNSATYANPASSDFESLSINTTLADNKQTSERSPTIRARRFSGDIVLPPLPANASAEPDPLLFSPGSVRARTISSIQENHNLSLLSKQRSSPPASPVTSSPVSNSHQTASPLKRLDVRLSSGKTMNSSDFIHTDDQHTTTDHLTKPLTEVRQNQATSQQPNHTLNETTRYKLLQAVYVNNNNPDNPSSLAESLINGTNSHVYTSELPSNCILS